jgi:hypothetical protein
MDKLNNNNASYKNNIGATVNTPTFADYFKFISKHSHLEGYFKGEALPYTNYSLDRSKLGVTAYVVDKNGKRYFASINKYGTMTIDKIPVKEDDYTLVVDIPGHFEYRKKVKLSKNVDGELQGLYYYLAYDYVPAGDVNGDGVIDIHDAILVANQAGKTVNENSKEDLNKDGVVDINDFNFIVKNFMKINPYVPTKNKPVEKSGNNTLEELKKRFN